MSDQYLYSNSDHVEMVVWNKVNHWYRICQFNILNDDAKSPKKTTCEYHLWIYFIFKIVTFPKFSIKVSYAPSYCNHILHFTIC